MRSKATKSLLASDHSLAFDLCGAEVHPIDERLDVPSIEGETEVSMTVNLDAMIQREDFEREASSASEEGRADMSYIYLN